MSMSRKSLRATLAQPIDGASLAVFRMLFGALMLWEVTRYFSHSWIHRYYVEPTFHGKYFGFGWVEPLPEWGMYALFVALGVFALGIALGLFYRVCSALFFLGATYVFLLDATRYLNHFYLICLLSFLMIFIPAHRLWSLDAKRTNSSDGMVPRWSLWLLRAQLFIVYSYAGIAKINPQWLRGEPMRTWLKSRADFPVVGPLFLEPWTPYFFSYGGLLFDLAIAPLLLWSRTRPVAFVFAMAFHLTNFGLFQIGVFPWLMIAATFLFFSPSWPRKFLGRSDAPVRMNPTSAPLSWATCAFLGAFLLWQALFPLRHLLYPGYVNWTEEGHLFSWHMKLRTKISSVLYKIEQPSTGWSVTVDPQGFLPYWQFKKLRSRPELIRQFAVYLREDVRRQLGRSDVKIYALTKAYFPGEKMQPLVDPTVDLLTVESTLWPAKWIVPFGEKTKENVVQRD